MAYCELWGEFTLPLITPPGYRPFVFLALAAVTASWNDVPSGVVTGIACIGTVLASMNSFLKPAKKQSIHHTFSRNLQLLRIQMICCETEKNYKKLWSDFNKQISEEPLIFPKTFANAVDQNSTEIERQPEMSMELLKVEYYWALQITRVRPSTQIVFP